MRRIFSYIIILSFLFLTTNIALAKTQQQKNILPVQSVGQLPKSVSINSSNNLVANKNVVFVSSGVDDFICVYELNTAELLTKFQTGKRASSLSLFNDGKKELLAVVNLNDPAKNEPIIISLLDISQPKKLKLVSAFILPPDFTLANSLKPVFDATGDHLIIADKNIGNLLVFETATGRMTQQLSLNGGVSNLSIFHQGQQSLLAATSITTAKVTVLELNSDNKLKSVFFIPPDAGLTASNNLVFNKTGNVAYIAATKSNKLFSFNTSTGLLIDQYDLGDSPSQIALASFGDKAKIAIVNTGKNHGFLANSVSIVESDSVGVFWGATVFIPPANTNFVASSNLKFSDNGEVGFVGTQNQDIFLFDTKTGEQLATAKLIGTATKFTLVNNKLVALTNETDIKRLVIIDLTSIVKPSINLVVEPKPILTSYDNKTEALPLLIKINRVKACKVRKTVKVKIIGKGFKTNSQILVNDQIVTDFYLKGKSLLATFPVKFLHGKRQFQVVIKNSDGTSSLEFNKQLNCRR
ncbi:MAG: hypothetical protein WAQ98_07780 [Blastocatellia bacterium]